MFTGISKKLQVYTIMLSPFPQSLNTPINISQTVIFHSSSKLFTSIVMSEMRFCDCIFDGRVICYYYPNRIREPIYDWGQVVGVWWGQKSILYRITRNIFLCKNHLRSLSFNFGSHFSGKHFFACYG